MLELPEIELIRRDLEREVGDRKIKTAEFPVASIVKTPSRKALIPLLEGTKLTGVTRKGELILFMLEGTHYLVLTIGESTRLTRNQPKEELEPKTAAVFTFTQGGQLRIVDPEGEATLEHIEMDALETTHPELAELGFDAVDEPISWVTFGEELLRRDGKLKAILMDPTFLIGIGPMYSDEILFHAGLRYDRLPKSLSTQEIRRLYRAVVETVHDAIKYRGTTLGEDGWVNIDGTPGEYQQYIAVYQRDGEMSPRARGPVVKARFAGAPTYFCEQTQV